MSVVLPEAYPYAVASGAAGEVNEEQWGAMAGGWHIPGVIPYYPEISPSYASTQLEPFGNSSGMFVYVRPGQSRLRGVHGNLLLQQQFAVPNPDPANPRIDTLTLRNDLVANTVTLYLKPGTPDVVPVAPAMEITTTVFEEAIGDVRVNVGASTIAAADVTDRRRWSRAPDAQRLQGRVPGAAAGDIAFLDANGRVPDAAALQGRVPGTAAGDIALLDANGRVPNADLFRGLYPTTGGDANQIPQLGADGKIHPVMLPVTTYQDRIGRYGSPSQTMQTSWTQIAIQTGTTFMSGGGPYLSLSSIIAGVAGYYVITAAANFGSSASGNDAVHFEIRTGGGFTDNRHVEVYVATGFEGGLSVSGICYLEATSDVNLWIKAVTHIRSIRFYHLSMHRVA